MKRVKEKLKSQFNQNNIVILLLLICSILLMTDADPSGERNPPDGSSLYEEITPSPAPAEHTAEPVKNPARIKRIEMEIDDDPQVLFFLELDLSNPDLEVFPVLAQDRIFGFELLSAMDARYQADATVNAGFNFAYGQPSGLVIQNGRLLSGTIGYGRALFIKDRKCWFRNSPVEVWLDCAGEKLPVDNVNPYPATQGILVFTPEYGPTNRMEGDYTVCVIQNNRVMSVEVQHEEADIPDDGFLVVDRRVEGSPLQNYREGQEISLQWDGEAFQGYQCSGALVEQGKNVARDQDAWGGNMLIQTPRTAVGLKDQHTLVFLVADGRQPGYSAGLTGKQLADVLIAEGVTEAALLDGGASSEMIVNGEIVNKPSTGKERLLASGFIIRGSGSPVME